ncbi:Os01g0373200, partial [Oryza sativa Japonica Group]
ALLLFRQADLPSLLSSYIVQVVIHYFDKQSAEFINSAAGAITVSYVMQLLTGRICIMCFLQRDNVLGVCKKARVRAQIHTKADRQLILSGHMCFGLLGREFSAVIYATQTISDILSISGGE